MFSKKRKTVKKKEQKILKTEKSFKAIESEP